MVDKETLFFGVERSVTGTIQELGMPSLEVDMKDVLGLHVLPSRDIVTSQLFQRIGGRVPILFVCAPKQEIKGNYAGVGVMSCNRDRCGRPNIELGVSLAALSPMYAEDGESLLLPLPQRRYGFSRYWIDVRTAWRSLSRCHTFISMSQWLSFGAEPEEQQEYALLLMADPERPDFRVYVGSTPLPLGWEALLDKNGRFGNNTL